MTEYRVNKDLCEIVFSSPIDGFSYFFGYYDLEQVSPCGRYLACVQVDFDGRDFRCDDSATVGYFNLATNEFVGVGRTTAINWQQGCRLHWLNGGRELAFNTIINGCVRLIVHTLDSKEEAIYPAFCARFNRSDRFISFGYGPVTKYRSSYGYAGIDLDAFCNRGDFVKVCDLESNKVENLLSFDEILEFLDLKKVNLSAAWIEHISVSPDDQFLLLFLRTIPVGEEIHVTLPIVYNLESEVISRLPYRRFYSHFGWRSGSELVIWCSRASPKIFLMECLERVGLLGKTKMFVRLLSKIYPRWVKDEKTRGDGQIEKFESNNSFISWDLKSGKECVLYDISARDGHNSFTSDGSYMLFDSYEDQDGCRHLFIYSMRTKRRLALASFNSHYNATGWRCDLHPRFSPCEGYVGIDVAVSESRRTFLIRLNWVSIKYELEVCQ